ncbi:hypothetical protein Ahos_0987 [Acidianus hospitalis W1]|uniref:Uncharacterized protein n=1 Tax=Acidianus hospitalis (strain W1) TaxID=933801 RepID=F4B980_ACIHW|nr:hypothetical protein Ahos_0987 [Acidianus hospitalis W1]
MRLIIAAMSRKRRLGIEGKNYHIFHYCFIFFIIFLFHFTFFKDISYCLVVCSYISLGKFGSVALQLPIRSCFTSTLFLQLLRGSLFPFSLLYNTWTVRLQYWGSTRTLYFHPLPIVVRGNRLGFL